MKRASFSLALVLCGLGPRLVLADAGLVPLDELIGQSANVVIGRVTAVTEGSSPGPQTAVVSVEENLLGTAPRVIRLEGDTRSPEMPHFRQGVLLLLFLRSSATPTNLPVPGVGAPAGGGLEPVGGGAGIVDFVPEARDVTRRIVTTAIARGAALAVADVHAELLRGSVAPPRALLGALLQFLSEAPARSDAPLLVEMACDLRDELLPEAQLWAIGEAGLRKLSGVRDCLEGILRAGTDLGERIGASEALGDLGDPQAAPLLLSILSAPPDETEDPSGASDGGLVLSVVLALGKIGEPDAVPELSRIALEGDDLALHSTVVHALGLIGGRSVLLPLADISRRHPNDLIRQQARETLARLGAGSTGGSS